MKQYDPDKPLISIHVPKCAGSSFSSVLKKWFGRGYLPHYYNEKACKPPKAHSLSTGIFRKSPRRGVCIHGHFNNERNFGVNDYYPDCDQLIAVLRDPFEVHLSNYFYVIQEARRKRSGALRSGQSHPIIANGWNLEEFLQQRQRSHILQFLPPNITLENYRELLEERFLFIGVSEKLQSTVDSLSGLLGFPGVRVQSQNASTWTEEIPEGARERFETNNQLVMEIYGYVLRRWNAS